MKFVHKILEFLKKFYDKIILGILLLIWAIVLFFQINKLGNTQDAINNADENIREKLPGNELKPFDESNYELDMLVDTNRTWKKSFGEGTLVDPGNYVYSMDASPYLLHLGTKINPYTGKPDTFGEEKTAQQLTTTDEKGAESQISEDLDSDSDGITDVIEIKFGLDKNNPADAAFDKDQDGFDNLEEVNSNTLLDKAESRPRLISRLRALKKVRKKVDVLFKNINRNNEPDDKNVWDIEIKYKIKKRWKSGFLKVGAQIPGSNYKIVDVVFRETIENNIPVDVSEMIIQKKSDDPLTLVRNKTAYEGDPVYELIYFMNKPRKIRTELNKSFALADLKKKKELYKIIDEKDGKLNAELIGSNERFTIEKFSPEDKKRFLTE